MTATAIAPVARGAFATVNPATGEQIETFTFYDAAKTEKTLALAAKSFESFRKLSTFQRAKLLSQLGEALRKNKAQLAKVISTEMGKVFSEAEAEIEKCASGSGLVCGAWPADHGGCSRTDWGCECLRFLFAVGSHSCDHAVEFSHLAVDANGDPNHVGRQCGAGEALHEYPEKLA
jgi:hypothetical protein